MAGGEGVSQLWQKEDWWAVWIGFFILLISAAGILTSAPKMGKWESNPATFFGFEEGVGFMGSVIPGLIALALGLAILFAIGSVCMNLKWRGFFFAFFVVFLLAILSYFFDHQKTLHAWGLGYAFWALLFGLLISNTIGTPEWLKPGIRTEFYIKTGLVLLGAEVLFNKILQLGPPGLFVAWLVTPIVVIFMFWFGTNVMKMSNKALVIVIATATSVCGVSAAIAAAAASKAKKDDLTLAVGMTLIFTVLMMIGMPALVKASGMDLRVGAAWMGGTIDATGAVVAAGEFLGEEAGKIAAVVKMIQNVLIGVIAFCIAVYWAVRVEGVGGTGHASLSEIWVRFPKFILGFIGASIFFSFVLVPTLGADAVDNDIIKATTKNIRGWLFCLAFVSIGLESNFRDLSTQLAGGKPMILYIVGQSFNLALTLLAAYLAFGGIL
ncbi:MAG: putative sulfate exporter family transporter, partial [Candidatus Omnitrophica bacterium]|nr:putative sulfate exporter family transporter [Candidatus Omnitrophota bacterium]